MTDPRINPPAGVGQSRSLRRRLALQRGTAVPVWDAPRPATHTSDGRCTCAGCTWGDDRACTGCGEVCGTDWCPRCQAAIDAPSPAMPDGVCMATGIPCALF